MRISKIAAAVALGVSAVGLSACATGFPAKVSRYQAMPAPQGQSFVIVPVEARDMGGLQFSRYADMVGQAMQAQGYSRASSIDQATMVVQIGYGVDQGRTEYVKDPFSYGRRYDPFWDGYYGRPYYSRWGFRSRISPFYYGWNDPFWYSPFDHSVRSYTSYRSELTMNIRRKSDNASLFEGKAQARSTSDDLNRLVPNLIEAMFTGFPGRSGETVRITVPPAAKQAQR